MKFFFNSILIFALVLLVGCSKEKPAEPAPAVKPESAIFKKEINTLHKAEALDQAVQDAAVKQQKDLEAATK